jgi:hypothetical protein
MSPFAVHAATDAPSAWNDFLPWLLLGLGVFVLLFVVATGMRWKRRPPPSEAAPASPGQAPQPPRRHASTRDLAVLTFDGLGSAERAFGRVRDDARGEPWLLEVAFAERHRHDRLVVRGTFAGRYLDIGDAGGDERPAGALFDEIRDDVPVGSSAVVIFGPTDDVDEMAQAFEGSGGHLARHRVSDADAAMLEASVSDAPPAAEPSL